MRIPLGNFDQPGQAAQPLQHDVGPTPDVSSGGEALGTSLQQAGADISQVADAAMRKKKEEDEATATSIATGVQQRDTIQKRAITLDLAQQLQDGTLKTKDAQAAQDSAFAALPKPYQIPNIHPAT